MDYGDILHACGATKPLNYAYGTDSHLYIINITVIYIQSHHVHLEDIIIAMSSALPHCNLNN